jgi:hypothetical protein
VGYAPKGLLKSAQGFNPGNRPQATFGAKILGRLLRIAFIEVQLLLRARGRGTTKDLDTVGTPHFAQFVPLEDNQLGFFTVNDGSFDHSGAGGSGLKAVETSRSGGTKGGNWVVPGSTMSPASAKKPSCKPAFAAGDHYTHCTAMGHD